MLLKVRDSVQFVKICTFEEINQIDQIHISKLKLSANDTLSSCAKFWLFSRIYTSVAAFNVLIRANALPLSITIITVATPSPVNETNISSANINDNDFAPEIC